MVLGEVSYSVESPSGSEKLADCHWVRTRGSLPPMQDTTAEAAEVLARVHRQLSGARKIIIACQMSDSVREMARARIRVSMPQLDEASVREQLIWELYGVRRQR